MKACKKPCGECPWRKISPTGWLGDHPVGMYAWAMNVGRPIPCHARVNEDMPVVFAMEKCDTGELHTCAGYLLSASKTLKSFRANELEQLRIKCTDDSPEFKDSILSLQEFRIHHKKTQ